MSGNRGLSIRPTKFAGSIDGPGPIDWPAPWPAGPEPVGPGLADGPAAGIDAAVVGAADEAPVEPVSGDVVGVVDPQAVVSRATSASNHAGRRLGEWIDGLAGSAITAASFRISG